MPLYEFHCPSCGHEFEELTRAGALAPCPACGQAEAERRFSPVAVPRHLGLRGPKARDSNARRAEREAVKRERFAERRKARRADAGGG